MSIANYDLPVSFYFKVIFVGITGSISFKEVSGLSAEIETESINEGGLNEYDYKLPKQIKHTNLILKRALMPLSNTVETWVKDCIENDFSKPIKKKDISIYLLDNNGEPLMGWNCEGAYPIKWEIESLDSEKNGIIIETIEFAYLKLRRKL